MSDFLYSDAGIIARHHWRKRQRAMVIVNGIEPAAKRSMPDADKLAFQERVASGLALQGRRAFRNQLALRLSFTTVGRTPTQLPKLGKNFMDLLATPLPGFPGRRRGILYRDDRQVDALSVSCRHVVKEDGYADPVEDRNGERYGPDGEETPPRISLTAVRHALYLEDLASGAAAERHLNDVFLANAESDPVAEYQRMLNEHEHDRRVFGDALHPFLLDLAAREAQERVLRHSRLSLGALAYLHGVVAVPLPRRTLDRMSDRAVAAVAASPTRMMLGELPVRPGQGAVFRDAVSERLEEFWGRWRWLFGERLRIPIALEVLVKPPIGASDDALHDLDNVVRDYLVNPIVNRLQPPIDIAFGFDPKSLRRDDGALPAWFEGAVRALPKSARVGLTRYEAWRIRRAEGDAQPGFVSIGLAPDPSGTGSAMSRADGAIEDWFERLREIE